MIKNPVFVTLHNDYSFIHIGLFQGTTCLEKITDDHKQACSRLLVHFEDLLIRHNLTIRDLNFIAVHQGPGPYTTLRITLSTANGIAWASKIPLIGVDGFSAFLNEIKNSTFDYTIILLNAFCGEVYYAIQKRDGQPLETGYLPVPDIIEKIRSLTLNVPQTILFAGNGIPLCEEQLKQIKHLSFSKSEHECASIEAIANLALKNWFAGNQEEQLLPLYLKHPVCTTTAKAPSQP